MRSFRLNEMTIVVYRTERIDFKKMCGLLKSRLDIDG